MQRFLVGATLLLSFLAGCSSSSAPTSTAPGETPATTAVSTPAGQAVTYTCPMHPEVLSDKPGKCPKCQMELVLKK